MARLDPAISLASRLEEITGSSPVMTKYKTDQQRFTINE
jgi:ribosomal protein L5